MHTYDRFLNWASAGTTTERTAFFSDAVFAISMTLLAVELHVPEAEGEGLARAIAAQWPSFGAYALSFAVIGGYWLAHHRLFRLLDGFTAGLQRLNLLVLLFVGLIAYGTAVIVEYGDQAAAVITYAVIIGAIGVAQTALWIYASRARLFTPDLDRALYRHLRDRSLAVPVVFLASIPIALLSPDAAKWAWLGVFVIDALLIVRARREPSHADVASAPTTEESPA